MNKPIIFPHVHPGLYTLLAVFLMAATSHGQILSAEFRQENTELNQLSTTGVPISREVNIPPGSNGQMPGSFEQGAEGLTENPPTPGQFQGFHSFGGVIATTSFNSNSASYGSFQAYAEDHLPVADVAPEQTYYLTVSRVGGIFAATTYEFFFGSIIYPPQEDENGNPLTIPSTDYWAAEPVWASNLIVNGEHSEAPYYWSQHARVVFANQIGRVRITWRRQQPVDNVDPADFLNSPDHVIRSNRVFRVLNSSYLVSGTAVRSPRKLYWTEGNFANTGITVSVPDGVGAKFVFNPNFPELVDEPFSDPSESVIAPADGSKPFQDLRTVYLDANARIIRAYNHEGRILVELLGDSLGGSRRVHLGMEIVDVVRRVNPTDVTVHLGEKLAAWQDGMLSDAHLVPEPSGSFLTSTRVVGHTRSEDERFDYYAVELTQSINDYMLHWLETGLEGIRWPNRFVRYRFVWPDDLSMYSHYMRPPAATREDAMLSGIQLPPQNSPVLHQQTPRFRINDSPASGRLAEFTSDFRFYSWLDNQNPAQRSLIRYSAGAEIAFERVFSWYQGQLTGDPDGNLQAGPQLAVRLSGPRDEDGNFMPIIREWNALTNTFSIDNEFAAPRAVNQVAYVGERINAPVGDTTPVQGEPYWAGRIIHNVGEFDNFHSEAYSDPITSGFEVANRGAIIPVNAIPGRNKLEVWWFRRGSAPSAQGFLPTYWPSIIGRYDLEYPPNPREIVLAGNDGTGPLQSLEASGRIYAQNDPSQPGYNPNEEHALVLGGQAYALRDDLNHTTPENYSSEPFVLLEYTESDGRPAISAFKVRREAPERGLVFDYIVEAGSILQAPMPLPLLPAPVDSKVLVNSLPKNYNIEIELPGSPDLPVNWNDQVHGNNRDLQHYNRFTFTDRKDSFWVYRGLHAGEPGLAAGTYDPASDTFIPPAEADVVPGEFFRYTLHASQRDVGLILNTTDEADLPDGLLINGISIEGTLPSTLPATTLNIPLELTSQSTGESISFTLTLNATPNENAEVQGPLALTSTVFDPSSGRPRTETELIGRTPQLSQDPTAANSFAMRFYYKTRAGFAWPNVSNPPAVGEIVPYLRPLASEQPTGNPLVDFVGNPANRNSDSLEIIYRPVWPASAPTLQLGDTLMTPKDGLPAVRGQTSVQVLYDQSTTEDITRHKELASVVLHDPTREKEFDLAKIPSGVLTDSYLGRIFFPNLPPHLANRLFYDPLRGSNGRLVLRGDFRSETFGTDYILLNVLRGDDLDRVVALCPANDPEKAAWDEAVNGLTTLLETFVPNELVPGQFISATQAISQLNHPPDDVLVGKFGLGMKRNYMLQTIGVREMAEVTNHDMAVDSYALSGTGPGVGYVTLMVGGGAAFTPAAEPVSLHIIRVIPDQFPGELKVVSSDNPLSESISFLHSPDLAGRHVEYEYDWRIASPVNGLPPTVNSGMDQWVEAQFGDGKFLFELGGANIRTLSDNYVVVRYRPKNQKHPLYAAEPTEDDWSEWTSPLLAEGWIKRVLAGINPFNQRTNDFFSNSVNTEGSLLTLAGPRWEGDVALNLENINDFGLIEIYETVLRRGRMLSVDAGINFGPANDALLLAAGYLSDLYTFLGNEAWADAADPTIGISTADNTFGDIATSMFAFQGQVSNLLEEELALVRGRDDFLLPGVSVAPVYNRLIWNFTRGINAGEVIYALNYDIRENANSPSADGIINAEDAARLYPQGHGDAYGHYLTAAKGYHSLLFNPNFTWVPRTEAVLVLGQPVSVDYFDERKFASAASAVARAGNKAFGLTWRQDYEAGEGRGWNHHRRTRDNPQSGRSRYWGMDHWATRTGQGTYLNWVVGNAIIPAVDPNPGNEGIQKVDRTTVPELMEMPILMSSLQTDLNNAEAGSNPLGLPEGSVAFDISPNELAAGKTHFEQVSDRAISALNNAVSAFNDSKDVTRLMRGESSSLGELQDVVAQQERAYTNRLIEIFGSPYPDSTGPGRTYATGYRGPDLIHYSYIDTPALPGFAGYPFPVGASGQNLYQLNIQGMPDDWLRRFYMDMDYYKFLPGPNGTNSGSVNLRDKATFANDGSPALENVDFINFELSKFGFFGKPETWQSRRESPGEAQQAIYDMLVSHFELASSLSSAKAASAAFEKNLQLFKAFVLTDASIGAIQERHFIAGETLKWVTFGYETFIAGLDQKSAAADEFANVALAAAPQSFIAGLANGGDLTSPIRAGIEKAKAAIVVSLDTAALIKERIAEGAMLTFETATAAEVFRQIENKLAPNQVTRELVAALSFELDSLGGYLEDINRQMLRLEAAERHYRSVVANGNRVLEEREIFRKRSAAVIQGYRTRDVAFRIFRNEKLERYNTLFDLAARYAFLAAQAYDYETGLLGSNAGSTFISRTVNSRALGVVNDGKPQFGGSNFGDPGLSSVMAEMLSDWSVVRGRLGFNNPDGYGTTVSLRNERFRIPKGGLNDKAWGDLLQSFYVQNILEDADVRRNAMQPGGAGLRVPGLIIPFSTTIAEGLNLFGQPLMAGDSGFSPTSFATKIYASGVALEGYKGMTDPASNFGTVSGSGSSSPSDPNAPWLDPDALSATPYIYLLPVGSDSMRSPPLGDVSTIRTWNVRDVTLPLPFNIGNSQFSTLQWWQSSDFLTEQMFSIRKHQAFRPVSSPGVFSFDIYGAGNTFATSQFTNSRLIGRSVWNSQWKLVIPGNTLYFDSEEGLRRLMRTLEDIHLHFVTYSYSGN